MSSAGMSASEVTAAVTERAFVMVERLLSEKLSMSTRIRCWCVGA